MQERSGIPVTANKAIVGRNAFRHSSGIHQDGVLKHRENFECIDPATIGHPTGTRDRPRQALGNGRVSPPRRGSSATSCAAAQLQQAFAAFQALADKQRDISDDEVRAICAKS